MSGFWKKKVPAFLLALVMVVGMVPAAMAEETHPSDHNEWYGWEPTPDGTQHYRKCKVLDCEYQQIADHTYPQGKYEKDSKQHWQVCSVCGAESTHENHTATGNWTYGSSDPDHHWKVCVCGERLQITSHVPSDNGKTKEATCTEPGYITYTCRDCGSPYTLETTDGPLGHSFQNGECVRCHIKDTSKNITVSFISNGSNFISPKTISSGSAPGNPGTPSRGGSNPSYTFIGWTTSNPGSNGTYTGQAYLNSSQVGTTTLTSSTTYYALYRMSATSQNGSLSVNGSTSGNSIGNALRSSIQGKVSGVTGTTFTSVTFNSLSSSTYGRLYTTSSKGTYVSTNTAYSYSDVNNFYFVPATRTSFSIGYTASDSGGNTVSGTITLNVSASSYSGKTITYKVDAGDSVSFSRADFQSAYQEYYSGTIEYIYLSTSDTINTSNGTVYANYDSKSEKAFTKSNLGNYTFYYNSSGGDYAINDLRFVAPKGADKRTVELTYRAYYSSSQYVEGIVEIKVSGGSSSKKGDITYDVDSGKEVSFDADDFNDFFQEEYSGDMRYVVFETSDTLSTSEGTVYYRYGASKEKAFSKSTIDDYKFYYEDSDYGDYDLDDLSFAAPKGADDRTVEIDFTIYGSTSSKKVTGTLIINVGDGGKSSKKGDITYQVDQGDEVELKARDFYNYFHKEYPSYDLRYVTFETDDTLSTSEGTIYYNYDGKNEKAFTKSTIDDDKFYYDDSEYGEYDLGDLTFVAPKKAGDRTVELTFTAYYSSSKKVTGTLVINIGDGDSTGTTKKGDITYEVEPGGEVSFDRSDFNDFFQEEYSKYSVRYVTFETDDTLSKAIGLVYFDYEGRHEKSFTHKTIDDEKFYYSDDSYGEYALDDLSFVAGDDFEKPITLHFTAWHSDDRYVEGTLVINPTGLGDGRGDVRYNTTYNTNVQINPNDIARFFNKTYPNYSLQYVELGGVPSTGTLYYNYYGVSKYGSSSRKSLTASNCGDQSFYFSPTSTSQYSLGELTYVPSGINYCASIPFTAYSTSARSVKGVILISVNMKTTPEVYGVTAKNTAVTFPGSALLSAVSSATNGASTMASIQLLELPSASVGTVYVGSGTSTKATTTDRYGYSTGTQKISQLRFVPASGYTGSVEIPYLAYNSSGNAIASGKFSLGVVANVKKFSDVTSSTWCYKYVTELSDAKVIDGYTNGTFKPDNTVTYGQALKLIMLASDYAVQKPTGAHPFSGYLDKAKADGLISGTVNLDAPITRLAVAQIAAKALDLSTTGLSSVKPFTDTSDVYVQALNAAGIVEGYFANGTSTYKPNNTLTRGQISAIVWRMNQLGK